MGRDLELKVPLRSALEGNGGLQALMGREHGRWGSTPPHAPPRPAPDYSSGFRSF